MGKAESFDCAIIGGGLGGLTLAIQLKRAGLSVALFEREQYPFHKVCGEYISMESWNFLERIGVPLRNMSLPRITQLRVSAPSGNLLSHALDPGGFGISRYKLDHHLAALAREAGVALFENTRVTDVARPGNEYIITANRGAFTSKLLLGAWGKRSNMDVKLERDFIHPRNRSLSNYIAVKYHVKADLPAHIIELHNFRDGYCGISKIEEDRYCMCYLTTAAQLRASEGDIKKMEHEVLHRNPFLKKYFTGFPSLYEGPLAISQVSFERKSISDGHVLMLGDAAGLITPLCGNGMSMAMHASKLLGDLIPQYMDDKDGLSTAYQEEWKKHFAPRLRAGRVIQGLFGNEWLTGMMIGILKPLPFITKKLISSTHGKPF